MAVQLDAVAINAVGCLTSSIPFSPSRSADYQVQGD